MLILYIMKSVSLTEFKREFSALVDLVKKGKESLLVLERGIPVIKVTAAADEQSDDENGRLLRLERAGHLVRASEDRSVLDVDKLTVRTKKKADLLGALLRERREGR